MAEATASSAISPLGILAGGGALPLDVAAAATAAGRPVHIVAIDGFADPGVAQFPHERVNLGQIGRMLASLRRAGCRDLLIAGALSRPNLFRLKLDLGALSRIPTMLALTRGGDDSVLRRVVRFFESEGFQVRGVAEVAPHLIAPAGVLGRVEPAAADREVMIQAARVIAALGPFDVGQAVVAGPGGIVGVEGVRGTDALLADVAQCGSAHHGGNMLVKLAKPSQEMRVDLPTVGPATIEGAIRAGLKGLALGAGQTVMINREALVAKADDAGLFIAGFSPESVGPAAEASSAAVASNPLSVLSRRAPTPADRRDIGVGRQLAAVLRRHGAGRGAVVAREHILAVSGALPVDQVVASLGRGSLWGRRAFRGQIGVLLLDVAGDRPGETDPAALPGTSLFKAATAAGLAGIVCLGAPLPEDRLKELVGWADEARIFLMAERPPAATDEAARIG
jgi:UDP-2,3-diacylglucosamine hydrolase